MREQLKKFEEYGVNAYQPNVDNTRSVPPGASIDDNFDDVDLDEIERSQNEFIDSVKELLSKMKEKYPYLLELSDKELLEWVTNFFK